jgi:amidohydrolase
MAGGTFFDIHIEGRGSHGARPHAGIDPVIAAFNIGTALQTVVSRDLTPDEMGVLSVTQIKSGDAYNVILERAHMAGTIRAMKRETLALLEARLKRVVQGVSVGLGVETEVDHRLIFAPLVNSPDATLAIADTAAELVGETNVDRDKPPIVSLEDFAFMLEKMSGADINIGNGETSAPVHNHRYDFSDEAAPLGAALWSRLIEQTMPPQLGKE